MDIDITNPENTVFRSGAMRTSVATNLYLFYLWLWKQSVRDLGDLKAARQQLLIDMAMGLEKPTSALSLQEGQNNKVIADNGNFTLDAITFSRGVLTMDAGAPRLLHLSSVVTNYTYSRPRILAYMQTSMLSSDRFRISSGPVRVRIIQYSFGSPDVAGRLAVEATASPLWDTSDDVDDWVGYMLSKASLGRNLDEIVDRPITRNVR